MKILVTGATGFIGRRVVHALFQAGHAVRCLVRPTSNTTIFAGLPVECVIGDVGDIFSVKNAVQGVEAVVHLASLLKVPWHPNFNRVNVDGTGLVAAACAAMTTPPRLLIVSSLAAAGPSLRPRVEVDGMQPISIYGRTKRDAEIAAINFADQVPITIARPPMVFGADDRAALPLFRSAARGLCLVPTRDIHRVSLIHVDDLAAGLVSLMTAGERVQEGWVRGEGVYYLAADTYPTHAELGRWIADAMGVRTVRTVRMPAMITQLAGAVAEISGRMRGQVPPLNRDKVREITSGSWICDASKAGALGFSPQNVHARLRETADGYRSAGWINSRSE